VVLENIFKELEAIGDDDEKKPKPIPEPVIPDSDVGPPPPPTPRGAHLSNFDKLLRAGDVRNVVTGVDIADIETTVSPEAFTEALQAARFGIPERQDPAGLFEEGPARAETDPLNLKRLEDFRTKIRPARKFFLDAAIEMAQKSERETGVPFPADTLSDLADILGREHGLPPERDVSEESLRLFRERNVTRTQQFSRGAFGFAEDLGTLGAAINPFVTAEEVAFAGEQIREAIPVTDPTGRFTAAAGRVIAELPLFFAGGAAARGAKFIAELSVNSPRLANVLTTTIAALPTSATRTAADITRAISVDKLEGEELQNRIVSSILDGVIEVGISAGFTSIGAGGLDDVFARNPAAKEALKRGIGFAVAQRTKQNLSDIPVQMVSEGLEEITQEGLQFIKTEMVENGSTFEDAFRKLLTDPAAQEQMAIAFALSSAVTGGVQSVTASARARADVRAGQSNLHRDPDVQRAFTEDALDIQQQGIAPLDPQQVEAPPSGVVSQTVDTSTGVVEADPATVQQFEQQAQALQTRNDAPPVAPEVATGPPVSTPPVQTPRLQVVDSIAADPEAQVQMQRGVAQLVVSEPGTSVNIQSSDPSTPRTVLTKLPDNKIELDNGTETVVLDQQVLQQRVEQPAEVAAPTPAQQVAGGTSSIQAGRQADVATNEIQATQQRLDTAEGATPLSTMSQTEQGQRGIEKQASTDVQSAGKFSIETPPSTVQTNEDASAPISGPRTQGAEVLYEAPARIAVSPLVEGDAGHVDLEGKKLFNIVFDVAKVSGVTKFVQRKLTGVTLGYYSARTSSIVIKFQNNLDITAHEIGHSLDDRYGLVGDWVTDVTSPFDTELSQFWPYGSQPPEGHPNPRIYERAEGVAEYLRAWIMDPEATEAAAPLFAKQMLSALPPDVMNGLRTFSNEVRSLAGRQAEQITMSNINGLMDDTAAAQSQSISDDLLQRGMLERGWDSFITALVNDGHLALRAYMWALDKKGLKTSGQIGGITPSQDYGVLVQALRGNMGKYENMSSIGFVSNDDDAVIDPITGEHMNVDWLLQPAETTSEKSIVDDLNSAAAFMVSGRVTERVDQMRVQTEESIEAVGQEALLEINVRTEEAKTEITQLEAATDKEIRKIQRSVAGRAETVMRNAREKDDPRALKVAEKKTKQMFTQAKRETTAARKRGNAATTKAEKQTTKDIKAIETRATNQVVALQVQSEIDIKNTKFTGASAGIFASDLEVAQRTVKEILAGDPAKRDRILELARRYRALADEGLKYMVAKGRISDEAYAHIRARNEQYVAMQRISIEGVDSVQKTYGTGGADISKRASPIKAFTGSTKLIENPYVNLLRILEKEYLEADKNETFRVFLDAFVGGRTMYDGTPDDFASVARQADETEFNADASGFVKVFRNGQVEFWQLAPQIITSLNSMLPTQNPTGAMKALQLFLSTPGRLTQKTTVLWPTFIIKQFIGDPVRQRIISNTRGREGDVSPSTPAGEITKEERERMFDISGASQAGHYFQSETRHRQILVDAIKKVQKGDGTSKGIILSPKDLFTGWKRLAASSEKRTRQSEFDSSTNYAINTLGYSGRDAYLYAMTQSRALGDYAQTGNMVRFLNHWAYIPFLNSAIQSTVRDIKSFKDNPIRSTVGLTFRIVLPSMLMLLWNAQDEEWEREYRELPQWRRTLFWNAKYGDGVDDWVVLPKPWAIGALGSMAELAVDAARGNDQAFDGYISELARAGFPTDVSILAGPFKAGIEVSANHNYFRDKDIIPSSDRKIDVSLRTGTKNASPIGRLLQTLTMDQADARFIDHILAGSFGPMGRQLVVSSKDINRFVSGEAEGDMLLIDLVNQMTGLRRRGPVYDSVTLNKVRKEMERRGLGNSGPVRSMMDLAAQYYDAPTQEERDIIQSQVLDYAGFMKKEVIDNPGVIAFYEQRRELGIIERELTKQGMELQDLIEKQRLDGLNREINQVIKALKESIQNRAPKEQIDSLKELVHQGFVIASTFGETAENLRQE